METAAPPVPLSVVPANGLAPPAGRDGEKRAELLLDALKAALAGPGEHRLFRWGKLGGLFPSRSGVSAEVALDALKAGLLEIVRTEYRGKLVVEWARVTPRGVEHVHAHDSPKAVLRELKEVLGATRAGVPVWMDEAKREAAAVHTAFEGRATELLTRLDALADRVEAALRRAEASPPPLGGPMARLVPWGVAALEYLDRRQASGGTTGCPLPELFHAVRGPHPGLTLPDFHAGLRRLHDARAVALAPPAGAVAEPEYALVVDGRLVYVANR